MLFKVGSKSRYFNGMHKNYHVQRINGSFGNRNKMDCTNQMLWKNANVSF